MRQFKVTILTIALMVVALIATIIGVMAASFTPPGQSEAAALPDRPTRVVSINACADQLAMLLTGPDQLIAITNYASDKLISPMTELASGYQVNHGYAEEIFALDPDLILAGTYNNRQTIAILTRLGFKVVQFKPAGSVADIFANLRRMGEILAKRDRAEYIINLMQQELRNIAHNVQSAENVRNNVQSIHSAASGDKLTVATYSANGYTSGAGTLIDEAIRLAGIDNLAKKLNLRGSTTIALETLIANNPDFVITQMNDYGKPALAQANFKHPAFLTIKSYPVSLPASYLICGTPFFVNAVKLLQNKGKDTPLVNWQRIANQLSAIGKD